MQSLRTVTFFDTANHVFGIPDFPCQHGAHCRDVFSSLTIHNTFVASMYHCCLSGFSSVCNMNFSRCLFTAQIGERGLKLGDTLLTIRKAKYFYSCFSQLCVQVGFHIPENTSLYGQNGAMMVPVTIALQRFSISLDSPHSALVPVLVVKRGYESETVAVMAFFTVTVIPSLSDDVATSKWICFNFPIIDARKQGSLIGTKLLFKAPARAA